MAKRNWIWILAFCTGSLLGQTAHVLAASLTYNLNFFNSNGTVAGTGSFSSDPNSSQTIALDSLPPPFTTTVTATGLLTQFSANVLGVNISQPSPYQWWEPDSTISTKSVTNGTRSNPQPTLSSSWTFIIPTAGQSSGSIVGLNAVGFNMSGGVTTPNTLWGGSWSLTGSVQQQVSGSGQWTASRVPEPSMVLLDLAGGLVLFFGAMGTKRFKKYRA
jgi:hypothetical protein